MKITKDTKIGDLIPEGMKYMNCLQSNDSIQINFEKEEVKDFEWYIEEYFKTSPCFYIREEYKESQKLDILNAEYSLVDFSTKIGLLKFICNDIGLDVFIVLEFLKRKIIQAPAKIYEIDKICPIEFLNSIFK